MNKLLPSATIGGRPLSAKGMPESKTGQTDRKISVSLSDLFIVRDKYLPLTAF
ncbi:hypothetical protein [uncultured Rikenella sp.]|uniref:hypothetical protein n=1 Tax=uncultured Rikenella sp. TaxID=368003 RepID=UPI0025F76749|nr:hypothetical protein [uncultured Rikenella sp.]